LETMVAYGIYTIKDLLLYSHDKLKKRNIIPLSECESCSFVYIGDNCLNCPQSLV
jgi:hypothetical protein